MGERCMNSKIASIPFVFWHKEIRRASLALSMVVSATAQPAMAQQGDHHEIQITSPATSFVASSAKPFAALMDEAMAVMDDGIKRAPMTGNAEHDFIVMMIPHHQGAIDMAKSVLLYTQDPELKNLAQGIITDQQNEIRVMQAWLQRYQAQHSNLGRPVK
jgi:uncharacterized protein (DUF305 family)